MPAASADAEPNTGCSKPALRSTAAALASARRSAPGCSITGAKGATAGAVRCGSRGSGGGDSNEGGWPWPAASRLRRAASRTFSRSRACKVSSDSALADGAAWVACAWRLSSSRNSAMLLAPSTLPAPDVPSSEPPPVGRLRLTFENSFDTFAITTTMTTRGMRKLRSIICRLRRTPGRRWNGACRCPTRCSASGSSP